jgi:hypothetical protein
LFSVEKLRLVSLRAIMEMAQQSHF